MAKTAEPKKKTVEAKKKNVRPKKRTLVRWTSKFVTCR